MSATLTTVVKRLTVVGGMRRVEDEAILDAPTRSGPSKTAKGSLLVLVTAQGPGAATARQAIRETVFQSYYRDPSMSVTSSLVRAIRRAHNQLPSLASGEDKFHNVGIGCMVFKDRDIYLAQTGPSVAFIVHNGETRLVRGLELLPDQSDIFAEGDADVQLFHSAARTGDIVILASDNLGQAVDPDAMGAALHGQPAAEVREALHAAWKESGISGDLSALVVEIANASDYRSPSRGSSLRSAHTRRDGESSAANRRSATEEADDLEGQAPLLGDRFATLFDGVNDRLRQMLRRPVTTTKRQRRFLAVVTLLLLVCGSALAAGRAWQDQQQEAVALSSMDEAEMKERQALASADPEQKRSLLVEATALIQQAEAARPGDPNLRIVSERIRSNLDNLTGVSRVSSASVLLDLSNISGIGEPRNMVVTRDAIFVLDPPSQLLRIGIGESGETAEKGARTVAVRKGDTTEHGTLGGLVALTFVPAGGLRDRDGVLVMDDKGALYEYDADKGLLKLALIDVGLSGEAPILGGYAGNLYILDTSTNRLLWCPPTSRGFDRFAYDFLDPDVDAKLSDAVAMVVDSNLYVLQRSGGIERFYGGKPQPFDASTPDFPIKSATALALGPSSKSLYVLDAGNQRIVEFGGEGGFRRQIKSTGRESPLEKARGLAVDESRGKFYLLSGQRLYTLDVN